ncbi:MAG: 16S rRNA (guanine(966)-N(2))-methyltransferase RsmD [Acidobacteriota bacterium]|jgi:16S rRNA (guanine966-N2)-methyltransferase
MRVISGKYRGRRLKGPKGMELRPTGDRLKETLFNILKPVIQGAWFVDVFSGTGSIGIEALSRGAGEVVFIERDPSAVALIRYNLELCGIQDGYTIVQDDVFRVLRALARKNCRTDILFFDPPYNWEPFADLLKLAWNPAMITPDTSVIIEHTRKAVLPTGGNAYVRSRVVCQGNSCLSFYKNCVKV